MPLLIFNRQDAKSPRIQKPFDEDYPSRRQEIHFSWISWRLGVLASWRFEFLETLDGASIIATIVDSPILSSPGSRNTIHRFEPRQSYDLSRLHWRRLDGHEGTDAFERFGADAFDEPEIIDGVEAFRLALGDDAIGECRADAW
jgi:hypothetical protein